MLFRTVICVRRFDFPYWSFICSIVNKHESPQFVQNDQICIRRTRSLPIDVSFCVPANTTPTP
jgi:hypothetical protein